MTKNAHPIHKCDILLLRRYVFECTTKQGQVDTVFYFDRWLNGESMHMLPASWARAWTVHPLLSPRLSQLARLFISCLVCTMFWNALQVPSVSASCIRSSGNEKTWRWKFVRAQSFQQLIDSCMQVEHYTSPFEVRHVDTLVANVRTFPLASTHDSFPTLPHQCRMYFFHSPM